MSPSSRTKYLSKYALVCVAAFVSTAAVAQKLMIYPAKGQTEEQLADDRYECHLYAFEQSGFDPSNPAPPISTAPIRVAVGDNEREGSARRGSIAGAIAGAIIGSRGRHDVGDLIEGAAVGSAVGGTVGSAVEAKGESEARDTAAAAAGEQADERARQRAALEAARADYQRAMEVCLTGRGYVVR
jgi:hypothetical protein